MNADRSPVVIGVDGSPGARAALEWAWAAAARRGAPLRAMSAFPVDDYWADAVLLDASRVDALRSATAARLTALVAEVRAAAGDPEVQVHVTVVAGAPAEHLVQLSEGAGLLVVGSRGRGGVRSTLLGSVALHCATSAACPVVVVHPSLDTPSPLPGARASSPRVVVGLDDSTAAQAALMRAVDLADELDAEVDAVIAVQPPVSWSEFDVVVPLADVRERALARAQAQVARVPAGSRVSVLAVEGPAGAVLAERSAGAALLVVGSRSRSALPGMLLGSVALHCVVHAQCPVMVVHPESAGRRKAGTPLVAASG
ncbi:universal stress protein [Blastococcus sp. CT_GayMR19]|uniref:universal stress protein n=1 Tax=Blastococcus sp. CT_GayMR19 TaxID=2559608 RepID=UPI001073E193|nr:universal stress protein [Blastococcus sp. CT_GayMR19]TFV71019.1 universal stress protein [Blastococcus sp. CT_GayMR19]